MSYIERVLKGGQSNTRITEYLEEEGFKYGTGALGEGTMYYVASGSYTVWFALCEDYISLYAEYDCGGEVGSCKYEFDPDNFDDFRVAYHQAVDWAKGYM